jgi:hypothetical protein
MNQALYAHMNNKRKMKKKIVCILKERSGPWSPPVDTGAGGSPMTCHLPLKTI